MNLKFKLEQMGFACSRVVMAGYADAGSAFFQSFITIGISDFVASHNDSVFKKSQCTDSRRVLP